MSDLHFTFTGRTPVWTALPGGIRCVWDMGAIVAVQQAWQSDIDGEIEWRDVPSVNAAPHTDEVW